MLFIGDVHGKIDKYNKIITQTDESIQLGDMGVGFINDPPLADYDTGHRFIRGNHDDPGLCRTMFKHRYLGDYGITSDGIMFISGARSIDKHIRTPGIDWWPDEELSLYDSRNAIDTWRHTSTSHIIASHAAPAEAVIDILGRSYGSHTEDVLSEIFEIRAPEIWVFGHYHISVDKVIGGTRFIGLDELECIDIDTGTGECHGRR